MLNLKQHIGLSAAIVLSIALLGTRAEAQRGQSFDFLSLKGPDPPSINEDIVN